MRRLILFSFALALPIYAVPPPSAREILDSVRLLESRQQIDLDGQLLETTSSRAFPEFPVLERRYLGRQGERRAYANGSLCLGRKTRETLRSHLCAKDRQPLVPKTDARGRIATGHE